MYRIIGLIFTLFSLLLMCSSPIFIQAQNIELNITGIRSTKGSLLIGVFKDGDSFKKEQPFLQVQVSKNTLLKGGLKACIDLEAGVYGISVLDDENSDKLMDFSRIGFPLEGYGFSNYFHRGLKRPRFGDFKFKVMASEKQVLEIKLKYFFKKKQKNKLPEKDSSLG